VLAALVERQRSGLGQVVDAAMVDGSALLTSFIYGLRARGAWRDERGMNLLDGGAPFYDTYATADGKYLAVGALEPQFYAALLSGLGLTGAGLPEQLDMTGWPVLRERFTEIFARRTRDEWASVFDGTDACVSPVLSPGEVAAHPHNAARAVFTDIGGVTQPSPAPRFGRTAAGAPAPPVRPGADTDTILAALGLDRDQIAGLRDRGAVA
jgi:alpha-methylacyl-CoA racemase